jgi:hypothetical protein
MTFKSSSGKMRNVATLDSLHERPGPSPPRTTATEVREKSSRRNIFMGGDVLQKMSKVSFEDFSVEGLVQEGAWGKVYAAKRASDGLPLALVRVILPHRTISSFFRNFLVTPKIARTRSISRMKSGQCLNSSEWRGLCSWLAFSKILPVVFVSSPPALDEVTKPSPRQES